jgi:hypothetical protein
MKKENKTETFKTRDEVFLRTNFKRLQGGVNYFVEM